MSDRTANLAASETAAADGYLFHIKYLSADGQVVHEELLKPSDFQPAVYATFFDGVRRGLLPDYDPRPDAVRIDPVFMSGEDTAARVAEFIVTVPGHYGGTHSIHFGKHYFRARASRVLALLMRSERMASDAALYYQLNAYLDDGDREPAAGMPIELGPASTVVPIKPGCRSAYRRLDPWDEPEPADLPVLIDRAVLEAAVEETRAQPDSEIGGFLLGHLKRDPETAELFLAVTGLVSAAGTTAASSTSVTFTPESFTHAQRMIRLRGEDEMVTGWYHSHPFRFCAECPLPTPAECIEKVLFYSLDDVQLMESTFPHPYMLGLLTAVEPKLEPALGHLPVRLFGYREGQIVRRGFEVHDAQ